MARTGICAGRVVLVTGAGRGIGRAHAIELAHQGAKVIVNDLGTELDGRGSSSGPAGEVIDTIEQMGGEAMANGDDVADWEGAQRMIAAAIEAFGRLDAVVTNAGFLRDRMLVSMGEDDWDAVVRVHLKGTFAPVHHAAAYWREEAKAGRPVDARIVTTTSAAGLFGNIGQANYAAAKAGIAAFTRVASAELKRYGVTANSIAPAARSRMTEALFADVMKKPESGFDRMAPENISPLVVWLASTESADVTGRVFEVDGGRLGVAEGWEHGPQIDKGDRWDAREVGDRVRELLEKAAPPVPVIGT